MKGPATFSPPFPKGRMCTQIVCIEDTCCSAPHANTAVREEHAEKGEHTDDTGKPNRKLSKLGTLQYIFLVGKLTG